MNKTTAEPHLPQSLREPLSQQTSAERLARLEQNLRDFCTGAVPLPVKTYYVNNHIHTTYSFSPYTPSDAAYHAWLNGLPTAGIMDHDSVSGAKEFIRAGQLLGIATTVGFECRCSMSGTPFEKQRLNNPDQKGNAYVACHGIPHGSIKAVDEWLAPFRVKRNERNRSMLQRINALTSIEALQLDFDRDVVPLSMADKGGSITERHLLYALVRRILAIYGKGRPVTELLSVHLGIALPEKAKAALEDADTPFYDYVLLGILKSNVVEKFYIDATDECPHISEFSGFVASVGAIPAYAYLGDVGDSVTGDKKAQAFEDGFLDELVPWLAGNGFYAITYMPTRNTPTQLSRIMRLCEENHLFQISGEDINSPSQSFICAALDHAECKHLIQSTWALIGHESAATKNRENGMFTEKSIAAWPDLNKRIDHFAALGRAQ